MLRAAKRNPLPVREIPEAPTGLGIPGAGDPDMWAAVGELPQDAAEIARVEAQLAPDLAGAQPFAPGQLVEDPRFGERQGAVQEVLLEHADLAGVEAIEAPDALDAGIERRVVGDGEDVETAPAVEVAELANGEPAVAPGRVRVKLTEER